MFDKTIIGAGLFGCELALTLAKRGFSVLLIDAEKILLSRASQVNQARVHSGLHYPRSLETAIKSQQVQRAFISAYPDAIKNFEHIYGIAKNFSKSNSTSFVKFARTANINVEPIDPAIHFEKRLIESAFKVYEPSFDANVLRDILLERLQKSNVALALSKKILRIEKVCDYLRLYSRDNDFFSTREVIIASYSGINGLRKESHLDLLPLKYELTEIVLGKLDLAWENLGLTIMDGPFASIMPFGLSGLHSISSVRFTPHATSKGLPVFLCQKDNKACNPQNLQNCSTCVARPISNFEHMLQNLNLFLKQKIELENMTSMFTVKTILETNEIDDSRPTYIKSDYDGKIKTILSGKVSTVVDLGEVV